MNSSFLILGMALVSVVALGSAPSFSVEKDNNAISMEMQDEYSEFKSTMKAKLSDIDKRIREIQSDMKSKSEKAKVKMNEHLQQMRNLRGEVVSDLKELGTKTKGKYQEAKDALQAKYNRLKVEVDKKAN